MSDKDNCRACGRELPICKYKTAKTCRIYRVCDRRGFGDNKVLHINNCKHYNELNEAQEYDDLPDRVAEFMARPKGGN